MKFIKIKNSYTEYLEKEIVEKNKIISELLMELDKARINNELNSARANEILVISNVNGNEKVNNFAKHIIFNSEEHMKDEARVLNKYFNQKKK